MSHSPTAARFAHMVARHPVRWLVGSLLMLTSLAVPALDMRVGQSDAGNEPESSTVRRAYDLVHDEFGPGANGPLTVAFDLNALGSQPGGAALRDVLRDVARKIGRAHV